MSLDCIVRNGKLVIPKHGLLEADIGIKGEKIVQIGLGIVDGEKILDYLLPPSMQSTFESIRPYGPMILIVVAIVLPYFGIDIIGAILRPPLMLMMNFLAG